MKIATIIVTYNGASWIEKCIKSLLSSSMKTEIWVIDNCSSDQTVPIIKTYEGIRLIENKDNLGFGKANNIGLTLAIQEEADYVFLLNQDAWIEQDTLEKLVAISCNKPEFGVISPVHLNGVGSNLDFGFEQYIHPLTLSDIRSAKEEIICAKFINAAMWLIPVSILLTIGGFDPIYAHYGEDSDWVNRLIWHRYKIGFAPNAFGYHDREAREAAKGDSLLKLEYIFFLSEYKNVNYPIGKAFAYSVLASIKKAFEDQKLMVGYIRIAFTLCGQTLKIVSSRKQAKSGQRCFLSPRVLKTK